MCSSGGETYCTDLMKDMRNCGMCGIVCSPTQYCEVGKCATPPPPNCGAPLTACFSPAGTQYCADLAHDFGNCGTCGRVCANGEYCNNSVCAVMPPPTCMQPMILCSTQGKSYCTDPNYDFANCGGCGIVCANGQTCTMGKCQTPPPPPDGGTTMTCPAPMSPCGGAVAPPYCADLTTDPRNCGGCNIMCAADQICSSGRCVVNMPPPSCVAPQSTCFTPDGKPYCADLKVDRGNCGGCGRACPATYFCNQGTCYPG